MTVGEAEKDSILFWEGCGWGDSRTREEEEEKEDCIGITNSAGFQ